MIFDTIKLRKVMKNQFIVFKERKAFTAFNYLCQVILTGRDCNL